MISTRLKNALAEKISTFCKHCVGDKLPFGQVQLPGYGAVAPGSCLVVGLCCARLSLSLSLARSDLPPCIVSIGKQQQLLFVCKSLYSIYQMPVCLRAGLQRLKSAYYFTRTLAATHAFPHKGCSEHSKRAAREYFSGRALQTQLDSASANRYFAELSCQPTGHQLMFSVQIAGMPRSAGIISLWTNKCCVCFYGKAANN